MTDGEIGKMCLEIFDMRPYFIEQRLKLRNPIYSETAAYGHMGRKPEIVEKRFCFSRWQDHQEKSGTVHLGETGLCKKSKTGVQNKSVKP